MQLRLASLRPFDEWDDVSVLLRWVVELAWVAGASSPSLLMLQPQRLEHLPGIVKQAVSWCCRYLPQGRKSESFQHVVAPTYVPRSFTYAAAPLWWGPRSFARCCDRGHPG